jgi:hypothetical protein
MSSAASKVFEGAVPPGGVAAAKRFEHCPEFDPGDPAHDAMIDAIVLSVSVALVL